MEVCVILCKSSIMRHVLVGLLLITSLTALPTIFDSACSNEDGTDIFCKLIYKHLDLDDGQGIDQSVHQNVAQIIDPDMDKTENQDVEQYMDQDNDRNQMEFRNLETKWVLGSGILWEAASIRFGIQSLLNSTFVTFSCKPGLRHLTIKWFSSGDPYVAKMLDFDDEYNAVPHYFHMFEKDGTELIEANFNFGFNLVYLSKWAWGILVCDYASVNHSALAFLIFTPHHHYSQCNETMAELQVQKSISELQMEENVTTSICPERIDEREEAIFPSYSKLHPHDVVTGQPVYFTGTPDLSEENAPQSSGFPNRITEQKTSQMQFVVPIVILVVLTFIIVLAYNSLHKSSTSVQAVEDSNNREIEPTEQRQRESTVSSL